ncbi:glucosidase [Coprinopsis sp. MPI-PUGE-AT-0042]|nr:glucosidase [Coprinopsis sp. MPI-PUGE-AT-0042]
MSSRSSPRTPQLPSRDQSFTLLKPSGMGILRQDSWFSLGPDPRLWGSDLSPHLVEHGDALHDPAEPTRHDSVKYFLWNKRGVLNLGCLLSLCAAICSCSHSIGYPIAMYSSHRRLARVGYNLGGINSTGQIPVIGNFGLIDFDTPKEAYRKQSHRDGELFQLVFSDEFNVDGRSFYPGDDPYWEAADLHYWATNNMEWYDPAAVTTAKGSLVITFSQKETHGLHFEGGQPFFGNKLWFTGGYLEVAVQFPGLNNVAGMWPAVWTMGNLGRAGYGATLEGMWPYTYDACDVGLPYAATVNGDHAYGYALSYLPGQKLSRCTCDGEDHPGPKHPDGSYVGRSAPEIDVFEVQVGGEPLLGRVSQSAQFAPFDASFLWNTTAPNMILEDPLRSALNGFVGNVVQQAASVVTNTDQRCYEFIEDCFGVFGFEYITWISDGRPSWTLNAAGVGANPAVEISARPIPQEPMYIIINLGMSQNFGDVDFTHLIFPQTMKVDYVRVYQPVDKVSIGCDPAGFPTYDYIERSGQLLNSKTPSRLTSFDRYMDAYTNPNFTTWRGDYGQNFPKNLFVESC